MNHTRSIGFMCVASNKNSYIFKQFTQEFKEQTLGEKLNKKCLAQWGDIYKKQNVR